MKCYYCENKKAEPSTPRKAGSPHIEETPKPKTESAKPKAKPKTPKMSKATAKKMVKGAGLAGAAKVAGAAAIPISIAAAISAPALYEMKRQRTPLSEKEKTRKEELSKRFHSLKKSEMSDYIKLTAREGRTVKKSGAAPKEAPKAEKKIGEDVKQNGVTKPAVEAPKKEATKSTPAKAESKKPEKKLAKNWTPELNRLVKERESLRKAGKSTAEVQNKINEAMGSKVRHEVKGTDVPKTEAKKPETSEKRHTISDMMKRPETKTQKRIDERERTSTGTKIAAEKKESKKSESSPLVQRLRKEAEKSGGKATLNRRKRK